MIPTLHIHLLSEFRLLSVDTPVTSVEWPLLQSFLAYLALHHGKLQLRTHLASLLWPDSTEAPAHSNLRTRACRSRQALPYADSFLHVERTRLSTSRPFQIEPYAVGIASQTGLRCALLSGRSFGNLCDGIPSVRLYHFWDGGGIRVGHLERSARTFCIGDLSSHGHRQITDA